jgi:dTDP-4-dehydrorhamnose reductase
VRVLVTGAGGQLGLDLLDAFAHQQVVGLTREQLDVAEEPAVAAAVGEVAPHVVVNAAAWTDVDGCERDPDRAHRVNALGPWWLARACREVGATLVTISTDYVFGGAPERGPDGQLRGWSEFDAVRPINVYGRSKAAGEQLVRETLPAHHIVRTAWLCGARGGNFVRTMLGLGRERDELAVVDDEVGSPTFTRDLAAAIVQLASSGRHGTAHLVNAGRCSRHELAVAALELAGIDVPVRPVGSEAFALPAPRPSFSVLDGSHTHLAGIAPLPSWRDGLAAMLAELGHRPGPA